MEKWMQIDLMSIQGEYAICNLYADGRPVQVVMLATAYQQLKADGFFVRPKDIADSAGVQNTSDTYVFPAYKPEKTPGKGGIS